MLGRLLLHTVLEEFSDNSTYTWFPLQTHESMEVFLNKLGIADYYDFSCPFRHRLQCHCEGVQ